MINMNSFNSLPRIIKQLLLYCIMDMSYVLELCPFETNNQCIKFSI